MIKRNNVSIHRNLLIVAALVLLFIALPYLITSQYIMHILIMICIYGVLAMYWNLLDGYLGIIHFGYAGIFGIGAYTSALLAMKLNLSLFVTIPMGGLLAGVIGFLVLIPCLKMPAYAVALVTIAFAETAKIVIGWWIDLTRGEMGLWGIPFLFKDYNKLSFVYAALVFLIVSSVILRFIIQSSYGKAFTAVRDDEISAACIGIKVPFIKLTAMGISCFFAGLAGAFYAHTIGFIAPSNLGTENTVVIMAMALIGGKGTLWGPLMGAMLLEILGEGLRVLEDFRLLIYGLLIVIVMLLYPSGIHGLVKSLFAKCKAFIKKQFGGHKYTGS